jgi:hypothetical protein
MNGTDDQISQAFALLSEQQKKTLLEEIVNRLRFDMQGGTFENQYGSGYQYGGQVQGEVPLGLGDLLFGVRGQSVGVETPMGKFGQRGVTDTDIGYRFGPNEIRASYSPESTIPIQMGGLSTEDLVRLMPANTPTGGISTKDAIRLMYRREF